MPSTYRFAPAAPEEAIVFGAARPGYKEEALMQWIAYVRQQGIQKICCLLPEAQCLRYTPHLLSAYYQEFGPDQVCWAPTEDFCVIESSVLTQTILPFLKTADTYQQPVLVHCSGGIGRTGQVLAGWLVHARGYSNQAAIATVRRSGRNPYEAVIAAPLRGKNPLKVLDQLNALLTACRSV